MDKPTAIAHRSAMLLNARQSFRLGASLNEFLGEVRLIDGLPSSDPSPALLNAALMNINAAAALAELRRWERGWAALAESYATLGEKGIPGNVCERWRPEFEQARETFATALLTAYGVTCA